MKVGVIGAGYWGPNLVRVFVQHPEVASVTVCDIDPARRDRMKKLYPVVELSSDIDALLADESIDAVVVALPAAMHHDVTKRALTAGKDG